MNLANLAAPFTPETAREAQRRSTASRLARKLREARLLEAAAALTRSHQPPAPDESRRQRVQKQIDLLLTDMEKAKSIEVRLRISAALERLWKLVAPTNGKTLKSNRGTFALPSGPIGPAPAQPANAECRSNG